MLETRGYRVAAFTRGIKELAPEIPAILLSSKSRVYEGATRADVSLAKGMYAPAELLERVRMLLVRKRGPKRAVLRAPQTSTQVEVA